MACPAVAAAGSRTLVPSCRAGGWQEKVACPAVAAAGSRTLVPSCRAGGWQEKVACPADAAIGRHTLAPSCRTGGWQERVACPVVAAAGSRTLAPSYRTSGWQETSESRGCACPAVVARVVLPPPLLRSGFIISQINQELDLSSSLARLSLPFTHSENTDTFTMRSLKAAVLNILCLYSFKMFWISPSMSFTSKFSTSFLEIEVLSRADSDLYSSIASLFSVRIPLLWTVARLWQATEAARLKTDARATLSGAPGFW